jgi:hypothetical protein
MGRILTAKLWDPSVQDFIDSEIEIISLIPEGCQAQVRNLVEATLDFRFL